MTQFIIFTGPKPELDDFSGLRAVSLVEDQVFEYIGTAIPTQDLNSSWVLRGRSGEPGDELCVGAMIPIQEGNNFEVTELGRLLFAYIKEAKAVTFFYGTDTTDLPVYRNKDEFIKHVIESLAGKGETPLEIYAAYKNNS